MLRINRTFTRYVCVLQSSVRQCSNSPGSESFSQPLSENDEVNPNFINRNPRNLERMGIARKQIGFRYEYPRQKYWYRLEFGPVGGFFARVVHCSGEVIVKASANEYAVSKFLYNLKDATTARCIALLIAQRCKECGITEMIVCPTIEDRVAKDRILKMFVRVIQENGICLEEKETYRSRVTAGIDYDDTEVVQSLHERQAKVHDLGEANLQVKSMMRNVRGRPNKNHFLKSPPEPQNFDPKQDGY